MWRDNEKPPAAVNLAAFAISRTEVTNGQYARCVHARGCTAPANNVWEKPGYANYPVTHVTWEQANDFAAFVGGRLPTEAEWEKACRGPDGYNYPWSYAYPTRELANYHEYIGGITPVEMFSPKGDSAYGLADMAGNVWEWTSSQYRTYPYVVDDGRENQEEDALRVQRGGAWMTHDDAYLRCAARVGVSQGRSQNNIGFRVRARSPGSPAYRHPWISFGCSAIICRRRCGGAHPRGERAEGVWSGRPVCAHSAIVPALVTDADCGAGHPSAGRWSVGSWPDSAE